jgi:hypothetical protein
MNVNKTTRRESALARLQAQLKSGKKPQKVEGKDTGKKTELTENDSKRIQKEITVLKERV